MASKESSTAYTQAVGCRVLPAFDEDPTWASAERHPTTWHRDTGSFADWFVASVLVHEVAKDQAPMQVQSWMSRDAVVASFHGHPGLCIIRDVWCLHRATCNNTAHGLAMPSFRWHGERNQ